MSLFSRLREIKLPVFFRFFASILLLNLLNACITLPNDYPIDGNHLRGKSDEKSDVSDSSAVTLTRDLLELKISGFEQEIATDATGGTRQSWNQLANHLILKATAFEDSRGRKKELFKLASAAAVESLKLNPRINEAMSQGKEVWELEELLGQDEMDAMLFWVTSVLYIFREGMRQPEPLFNVKWIRRSEQVLKRMMEIDPNWNGGAVLFSKALIFHAIPEAVGGDKQKAQEYLTAAVEASADDWMLARWGRATYFLNAAGKQQEARADYEYIRSQDIEVPNKETTLWRLYFHQDAVNRLNP